MYRFETLVESLNLVAIQEHAQHLRAARRDAAYAAIQEDSAREGLWRGRPLAWAQLENIAGCSLAYRQAAPGLSWRI
jgi:hypothetical protein